VDVADLARERSIPHGMWKMSKFFSIPMLKLKSIGASNWAAIGGLKKDQVKYAADDAFFQLYLMGLILERQAPSSEQTGLQSALAAWRATAESMRGLLDRVDNGPYREAFFRLRTGVCDAVDVLGRALGAGGSTTINDLLIYKPMKSLLAWANRRANLTLTAQFIRQNADVLQIIFQDDELRVRLRSKNKKEDDECPDNLLEGFDPDDDDQCRALVDEVLELLVKYEPPLEKRPSLLGRNVPEPFWVPAKALLSRAQQVRLERCVDNTDAIEACFSDDGMLLRLARHPRAADDIEHMQFCVEKLAADINVDEDEAKRRFNSDEKFMQFWALLRICEASSREEKHVERSLLARTRILTDAHQVASRVSPPVDWEAARAALEKLKDYRRVLSACIGTTDQAAEKGVQNFLDAVVAAWPNLGSLEKAKKRPSDTADGADQAWKRARTDEGKGRNKGKGKGKGKGKERERDRGDIDEDSLPPVEQTPSAQRTDGPPAEQAGTSQSTAGEASAGAGATVEPAPQNENTAGSINISAEAPAEAALQTHDPVGSVSTGTGAPAEAAPQVQDPAGEEEDDPNCPAG